MENEESLNSGSLLEGEDGQDTQESTEEVEENPVVLDNTPQKHERPEGIPEEFWDETSGSYKSDAILKAYESEKEKALSYRRKLSGGLHNIPEDMSEYEIDESWDIKTDDDANRMKLIAHEAGLTKEQFNSVMSKYLELYGYDSDAYKEVWGDREIEVSPEVIAQREKEYLAEEMKKLGPDGPQVVSNIRSWGRSLMKQGAIDQETFNVMMSMGTNAAQVKALDQLRNISGHIASIPARIGDDVGGMTREEVDQLIASPDYETNPVKQRQVREYFERVHP